MAALVVTAEQLATLIDTHVPGVLYERLRAELDATSFERFVALVFEHAGYGVENTSLQFGQGVDLKLYADSSLRGKPIACVSVKHHQVDSNRVGQGDIRDFETARRGTGVGIGYVVTNTDFTAPARTEAARWSRLQLVDGRHLVRYIAYIRGSRSARSTAPICTVDPVLQADALRFRPQSMTKVLAISNNKGGVGKTTTALYMAKRLGERSQKVLLVDLDSQTNLTQTLPYPRGESGGIQSIVDYFEGRLPLAELIRPTAFRHVYIIPSDKSIRLTTTGNWFDADDELRFALDLHAEDVRPPQYIDSGEFDWIIVDTPPEMMQHTRSALASSHYVLAPTEPGPYGESGIQQLMDTVEAIRGLTGQPIEILGCIVTKWQDKRIHNDAINELKQRLLLPNRIHLFETKIPYDVNIVRDESGGLRLPGFATKPASARYRDLLEEVLRHVNSRQVG